MRKVAHSLPAGTRLDNYVIREALGGGGFSVVYLADGPDSNAPVAIKEYMPCKLAVRAADMSVSARCARHADRFQRGRNLFFQEASILATLRHANIVDVRSFFNANGTVYMVMAYAQGKNLQHYIAQRRGRLSERFLLTVFPPLLDALRFIHTQGYLHLDIKPGNVHVRPGGIPLLLDFGAVHRRQDSRQQQLGHITSAGFSPIEQYNKTGYIGPWTDIYAIGASMRTCIEGRPPVDARERHSHDRLRPAVQQFRRLYSIELLQALDWAMEIDPLLRPQSVDEFAGVLPRLPDETPPELGAGLLGLFGGVGRERS